MAAPPHVFAIDPRRLRYGRFARQGGGVFAFEEQRVVELPEDTFASGVLGGAARDFEVLREHVGTLLQGLSGRVEQASLVLPDAWMRLAFVESGELPRAVQARDDVLRWKLERVLPVRVKDLRLEAVPAQPLPAQQEPHRWLVGFALESLVAQIESAFAAHKVWIGRITNETLASLTALSGQMGGELPWCLVTVHQGSYTLLFARGGEPILYRFRSLDPAAPLEHGGLVVRDLRLTRAFLEEQLPGVELGGVLLVAPRQEQERWRGWLAGALGGATEAVELRHLPVSASEPLPWWEIAPLLGAVCEEIP